MELTIKRREDQAGSSKGSWAIEEYPGLTLFKTRQGWKIKLGALSGPEDRRIWLSPGPISQESLHLYRNNPDLGRNYQTRQELIDALLVAHLS